MAILLTTVCSGMTDAEVVKQLEALITTSQDIQKTVGMISGADGTQDEKNIQVCLQRHHFTSQQVWF